MDVRIFNVRAITEADDFLHITEGELDAITLELLGCHAVGVPGANSWKRHHPRMFAGFHKVYVWGDGDNAGRQFAATVSASLRNSQQVRMPDGMDVNAFYLKEGADALLELMEA